LGIIFNKSQFVCQEFHFCAGENGSFNVLALLFFFFNITVVTSQIKYYSRIIRIKVLDILCFLRSKRKGSYRPIFLQTTANYGFMVIPKVKPVKGDAIRNMPQTIQGSLNYLLKLNQNQNKYYEI